MADLATAYVQLVPSLRRAESTIAKELDGVTRSAGRGGGTNLGTALLDGAKGGIGKIGGAIKSSIAAAGAAMAASTVAAGAGIAAIGKQALDSYAAYEQLSGGVEKLYGDSADTLKAFAQDAYKTSGLDANSYMEQATSFSASLIKSLGGDTERAAQLTDVAMRAMSDNANTFGTDIASVQNAFQGMAKGNYTMLDNLKLGYAGTQEGMMQLINDSGVLGYELTKTGELGEVGFDKMVEAVQRIQEQQGIAGTTAKEAATTIEGSINMTKAAWSNLLTELGKEDGDIGARIGELMSSATTALVGATDEQGKQLSTGILGRVNTIIQSVATALPTVMPQISSALALALPQVLQTISTMLPVAIQAATQLIAGVGAALPTIFMSIVPVLGQQVLLLINTLTDNIPNMLAAAGQLFAAIVQAITDYGPQILTALGMLLVTLAGNLIENVPNMLAAAGQLFAAIATSVGEAAPQVLAKAGEMLQSLWDKISSFDLAGAAADLISGLVNGIGANIGRVGDALLGGIQGAVDGALSFLGIASPSKLFDWVGQMTMEGLAGGVADNVRLAQGAMDDAMGGLWAAADSASSARNAAMAAVASAPAADGGGTAGALDALRSDLSNMRIYLDGNKLVGGISTRMDRALVV